jgi:uridine kinase
MSTRQAALPVLVAITGGSGSGKSWLAEKLAIALAPNATRLSLDDFYRDQSHLPPGRRARINFDHPRTIDWPAFEKVLSDLQNGRSARIPGYDFATHSRLRRTRVLRPKPLVLVEGLWLLRRPALRRMFDFSIFLHCPDRLRLHRRLKRDLSSRGRSAQSIRRQFQQMVAPMHRRFVAPQAARAQLVFKSVPTSLEIRSLAGRLLDLGGLADSAVIMPEFV